MVYIFFCVFARLLEVLVNLIFNYDGDWVTEPEVVYIEKLVNTWTCYDSDLLSHIDIVNEFTNELEFLGVQQFIVAAPYGKFYVIEWDDGIRHLQKLICNEFNVVNLFGVDEC